VHADVRSSTTSLQPVFRARLVPPPAFRESRSSKCRAGCDEEWCCAQGGILTADGAHPLLAVPTFWEWQWPAMGPEAAEFLTA